MAEDISLLGRYFAQTTHLEGTMDDRMSMLLGSPRDSAHHVLDRYYQYVGGDGEVSANAIAKRRVILGLMISSRYGVNEGIKVIDAAILEFEQSVG